jgi:hypothetical protein
VLCDNQGSRGHCPLAVVDTQVVSRGGGAKGGGEMGVGVAAAQVCQDEQGLTMSGQAPPAGADLTAALGQLPG